MAHHKAAIKSIRQTKKRTELNTSRISRVRTIVKKLETAIASGDVKAAQEAFRLAQKELITGARKGVLKLGNASRKVSRLNAKVKAMSAKKA